MVYIPDTLHLFVVERGKRLCEYCQTAQAIVISMEIDHIIPTSKGGETTEDNLCLSCINCNSHKRQHQTGVDEVTNETYPLFNPRTQSWNVHFEWDDTGAIIVAKTPIARVTIDRLRMNMDIVVQARQRWVIAGWHPPKI